MQRIFYASGSVLTGDAIAEAVLAYAQALAKSPLADTIRIPVALDAVGTSGWATLLIGPASQIMMVPEIGLDFDLPDDDELVDELQRRALLIGSPRPVPHDEDVVVSEEYE